MLICGEGSFVFCFNAFTEENACSFCNSIAEGSIFPTTESFASVDPSSTSRRSILPFASAETIISSASKVPVASYLVLLLLQAENRIANNGKRNLIVDFMFVVDYFFEMVIHP